MKLCGFDVGLDQPFFLIAGTCSIEGLQMSIDVAGQLKEVCTALGVPLIYKGSFDKANRSSGTSQRGVAGDAQVIAAKDNDAIRRQKLVIEAVVVPQCERGGQDLGRQVARRICGVGWFDVVAHARPFCPGRTEPARGKYASVRRRARI